MARFMKHSRLILALVPVLLLAPIWSSHKSGRVNRVSFEQIQVGMSEANVEGILGEAGFLQGSLNGGPDYWRMYSDERFESIVPMDSIFVTYRQDQVVEKAYFQPSPKAYREHIVFMAKKACRLY